MKSWKRKLAAGLLAVASPALAQAKPGAIHKVDFQPQKEASRLVLHYQGTGKFRVFQSEKQGSVVVEADNLALPASLTRAIDGSTAGGPVIQVTPYSAGDGRRALSKFVLQLKGRADVATSELPGRFVVELRKKTLPVGPIRARKELDVVKTRDAANEKSEEIAKKLVDVLNAPPDEKIYFGTPVTFEGNGVNVHDIFRLVGDASGLNIVTDSDVQYQSNYSLKDIPWDQLLDIVIQQAGLKASVTGNVVRIITLAKYNVEQEAKLKEIGIADEMEPVVMAVIPLSFATAEEMRKMIETLLIKRDATSSVASSPTSAAEPTISVGGGTDTSAAATGSGSNTVPMKIIQDFVRGEIQVDTRSNSLVVTNTKDTIERIRKLVKELDVPLPQVLIDAKVVIASETFSKSLGVFWGGRATSSGSGRAGIGGGFGITSIPLGDTVPDFSVSPGTGGALGFQLGAGRHGNLVAQLSLAEANGVSKTVASPRIVVNNKTKASVVDGQTLLISSASGANVAGELKEINASLSLDVTPQVTSVGSVLMDLDIKKDSPVALTSIETKQMKTQVLVDSGSTLVLGGVYQSIQNKSETGIPLLKDLPFIGQLFRTNSDSNSKTELMVFITPQIIPVDQGPTGTSAAM